MEDIHQGSSFFGELMFYLKKLDIHMTNSEREKSSHYRSKCKGVVKTKEMEKSPLALGCVHSLSLSLRMGKLYRLFQT